MRNVVAAMAAATTTMAATATTAGLAATWVTATVVGHVATWATAMAAGLAVNSHFRYDASLTQCKFCTQLNTLNRRSGDA